MTDDKTTLRERMLLHTYQQVESGGLASISMRIIARQLGCSPMAAYKHFENKEALLLEVAALGFDTLTGMGQASADIKVSPRDRLLAVLLAYFEFGTRHKHLFDLMFSAIRRQRQHSERFRASADRSFMVFAETVEAAIGGQQDLEESHIDQRQALVLWSAIHGMTTLVSNGFILDRHPDGLAEEELVLGMMQPVIDGLCN